jgi:DNA-binding response OmpR family regulator
MRILLAEDDKNTARMYEITLTTRNHNVIVTYNGLDCIEEYREELKQLRKTSSKKKIGSVKM